MRAILGQRGSGNWLTHILVAVLGAALRSVPAGIDGEAVQLSPPLPFVIRPARLRVRISARHPGTSPAARFPLSRA